MSSEIRYERDFRGQPVRIVEWFTEVPNAEARFAMSLIERFGLIAGTVEGEDTAGRAVTVEKSVEQTVARAFDLAGEAFRLMRERGLFFEVLPYEQARDKAREEGERN